MPRRIHPKLLSRIRPAVVVTQSETPPPSGASLVLSWDDDANNETGYLVEKSANNSTWTTAATLDSDSTGYTATELASNSPFYFRVSAVNGSGSETPTSIGPIYTPYSSALASPAITLVDPNTISFSGTAPASEPANGGYLVQYHKSGEPAFEQSATSPTLPVTIGGLLPDNLYYTRAYIYNDNYDGSRSLSPVSATVSATTLGYAGLVQSFSPAFYARLNEFEGVSAANEVGADGEYLPNNGTVWTGGTLGVSGALIDSPATAATFDQASSSYADFGSVTGLIGLSAVTMMAWVKVKAFANNNFGLIIQKGDTTGNQMLIILGGPGYGNSSKPLVNISNGSESYGTPNNDLILDPAIWYFVAAVFDGSATGNANRLKLYVNMVAQPMTFTGTIPATTGTNTGNLKIGTGFDGSLDEPAIIPSALTEEQLLSIYNASGRAL